MKKYYPLSFVMIALASCSATNPSKTENWQEIQQNNQVVWAEDGTELAVAVLHYEQSKKVDNPASDTQHRHFRHQIFLQDLDGKNRRPFSTIRPYQNGAIYYMREAGYVIVESFDPSIGAQRFDKLTSDERELLVVETKLADNQPCQAQDPQTAPQIHHSVIPSPDGKQLLHVYSPRCGEASIEFLDARDLSVLGVQQLLINEPLFPMWHPQGYAILTNGKKSKAWKVLSDQSPLSITPPRCLFPVTRSSNVSNKGQLAFFLDDGSLAVQQVAANQRFGCQ